MMSRLVDRVVGSIVADDGIAGRVASYVIDRTPGAILNVLVNRTPARVVERIARRVAADPPCCRVGCGWALLEGEEGSRVDDDVT
ncbi:hypothetical protein [Nocardioides sp. BYT-33-1]|uniref:hypothetical protein n=1 Tax=Nocardioides sp. BYT-33-1 TaxID=3416952 RepID=UPI003F53534D